jgi:hypothetical protein
MKLFYEEIALLSKLSSLLNLGIQKGFGVRERLFGCILSCQ